MIDVPVIEETVSICGIDRNDSSMRRTASLVRVTEAPSGNWTETKNASWSSSGRNPVGTRACSA